MHTAERSLERPFRYGPLMATPEQPGGRVARLVDLAARVGSDGWVMAAGLLLAVVTVVVALQDPPNSLAAALIQAVAIVLTIYASIAIGRSRGELARQREVDTHATSAWRRMRNLYGALGRQRDAINVQADRLAALIDDNRVDFEQVRTSLMALEYIVTEQIATADDALEDWRALIPAEVERLEKEARKRGQVG